MKEVMTQFWSTTIGRVDGRIREPGVEKVGVPRVSS